MLFKRKSIEEETFGVQVSEDPTARDVCGTVQGGISVEDVENDIGTDLLVNRRSCKEFNNARIAPFVVLGVLVFAMALWSMFIDWFSAGSKSGIGLVNVEAGVVSGSSVGDIREQEMLVFSTLEDAVEFSMRDGYVVNDSPMLLRKGVFRITEQNGEVMILEAIPAHPHVIRLTSTEDDIVAYVLMTKEYWSMLEYSFDK